MAKIRFPEFDGLRASAALMVFLFHAWFFGIPIAERTAAPAGVLEGGGRLLDAALENLGLQGVALFYVISGFLLYRPFVRARATRAPGPGLRGYLIRRCARIFPAYWLALTIIGLVVGSKNVFTVDGVLDYYLLLHIYSFDTLYGNPVQTAWTLGVELSFYAFLAVWGPLTAQLLGGGESWFRKELVGLGLLAAASFGWLLWILIDPSTRPHAFQPKLIALPAVLHIFVAGMLLAALSVRLELAGVSGSVHLTRWVSLLARHGWKFAGLGFLTAAVFGSHAGIGPSEWQERALIQMVAKVCVAVGLVAPAVFTQQAGTIPLRVLGARAILYVGLVSYGVYLWQMFVMHELFREGPVPLGLPTALTFGPALALALAVTVAVASISWFGLERRVIGWAGSLSSRIGSASRGRSGGG